MAEGEKWVLQADIDNKLAMDALADIEEQSKQLQRSADNDFKNIGRRVDTLVDQLKKAPDEIRKTGTTIVKQFGKGKLTMEEFRKKVQQLLGDLQALGEVDIGPKGFGIAPETEIEPAISVSGTEKETQEFIDTTIVKGKVEELRAIIDSLKDSITEGSNEAAANLQANLESALTRVGSAANLTEKEIDNMLSKAGKLSKGLVPEGSQTLLSEQLGLIKAESRLEVIKAKGKEMANSLSEDAQKAGEEILENAEKLEEAFSSDNVNLDELNKDLGELEGTTNKLKGTLDKAFKRDINKDLDLKKALASFKELEGVVKAIGDTGDQESQGLARSIKKAANEWIAAFNKTNIEADKLDKELKDLTKTGRELGKIGEDVEQGMGRGTRSIWKMGRALDSVGIRGGGNALRVVDAIRGIHPAVIVAAASLIGMVLVLKKVGEAAVAMGKKFASAFAIFVKESLDAAESLEILELQIKNLVGGSATLARVALDKILELSAELGADLSKNFAQIFLPLVDGFEQFEQLGRIAATFAAKTGKDVGEIAKALTQSNAEEFRRLTRGFDLNNQQIDKIQAKMEELGQIEGLIAGFNEYFEDTETGWNTFEGSLRRVKAQLAGTIEIIRSALGEPIKIALVGQMDKLAEFLKDNGPAIKNFFSDIGLAIGDVIKAIGEFADRFLGNIDKETLKELGVELRIIGDKVAGIFRQIGEFQADTLIDTLFTVLDIVETITGEISRQIALMQEWNELVIKPNFELLDALKEGGDFGPGDLPGLIFDRLTGKRQKEALDNAKAIQEFHDEEMSQADMLRKGYESMADEREKAQEAATEAALSQADAFLKLNSLTLRHGELLGIVKEASKELADAYSDLNKEMGRAFKLIFIEEGRRIMDMQIANTQKRLDLASKHRQNLEAIDLREDRLEEDRLQDHDDKLEDIDIEHNRRVRDAAIDAARKQEDLLEKHLRKLKEIKEKFDLDAQEAIRLNDAVALLRIRRRMELELRQEKRRFDEKKKDATEAEAEKNKDLAQQRQDDIDDADRANERKLRDNQTRIDREIEDEQTKYDELLKQQEIEEQRKADALALWLKRELDDFNAMWDEKKADLAEDMADTIMIYEEGLREIARINNQIRQSMQAGVGMVGAMFNPFGSGGGTGRGGISSRFGLGGAIGALEDEQQEQSMQLNHLRALATSLGNQVGADPGRMAAISTASRNTLLSWIKEWNAQITGNDQGNQFGGITNPGVSYTVGEAGPETFRPMQHGIIQPHQPMMVHPQSQAAPNISNNNSRTINADLSMLDPTSFTPVQLTLIRSIVTEKILSEGI